MNTLESNGRRSRGHRRRSTRHTATSPSSTMRSRPAVTIGRDGLDVDTIAVLSGLVADADSSWEAPKSVAPHPPHSSSSSATATTSQPAATGASSSPPQLDMNELARSGSTRDRYGFAIDERVAHEYAMFRAQTRAENRKKCERFARILDSDTEDYSDKQMGELVRLGIPPTHRRRLWLRLAGIDWHMLHRPDYYQSLLKEADAERPHSARQRVDKAREQIDKDVNRTFGDNKRMTTDANSTKLRNVLVAYALHDPVNGYGQGMNIVLSAFLVLDFEEEECFWMLCHVMRLFPFNFDATLSGCLADTEVFGYYLRAKLPRLHRFFLRNDVALGLFFTQFIMTLYIGYLQCEVAFRIWDRIMYNGPIEFFRCTLKLFHFFEPHILELEKKDIGTIVKSIETMFSTLVDIDMALAVMPGTQRIEIGALEYRRNRERAATRRRIEREFQQREAVRKLGRAAEEQQMMRRDSYRAANSLRKSASIKSAKAAAAAAATQSSMRLSSRSEPNSSPTESDDSDASSGELIQFEHSSLQQQQQLPPPLATDARTFIDDN